MLAQQSFKRDIPVTDMLNTSQLKEGFARLRYINATRGFCVITGSPGVGKSSLVRYLNDSLDKSKFIFCYINERDLTPKGLYSNILNAAMVTPAAYLDKIKMQFRETAGEIYLKQEKQLVVVIDNAQELAHHTLKELRYLFGFEIDSKSPLSMILIGHPELWDTLKLRTYEPLLQFVNVHFRIRPLDNIQAKEYIIHQLKLSEHRMCFPDDIVKKIHKYSSGIPRVINSICRNCLIDINSNKLDIVDSDVLNRVLNDMFGKY